MSELKAECDRYGATVTQYLTAVLIYSIYEANYKKQYREKSLKSSNIEKKNIEIEGNEHFSKKPIKVCIPVNLKKYFPSKQCQTFSHTLRLRQI